MSKKPLSLIEGRVSTTLLRFALPFLGANILQSLYGAIDLLIIGRYCDSAAIAAVSIGSQVMMTLLGLIIGVSTGCTVLIGQKVGEGDKEKAARSFGSAIALAIILAVVITPIMILVASPILGLMNTPTEALQYAKQYLITCACGIPFILGYNALSGFFRATGDSKTPMIFVFISSCINVVGNILLIGVFKMGALGAALATILSQLASLVAALIFVIKKGLPFEFHASYIRPVPKAVFFIMKVGIPLAVQEVLVNFSFLLITTMVNGLGVVASASVGIVEKILGFVMMPPMAFSAAVTTMAAQNIGAKQPKRALSGLKYGILYSSIFGIAITLAAFISAESITGIFAKEEAVKIMAATYLRPYSIDCILICIVFLMNGYFNGCGKSVISLVHSLVATFVVRVPLCFLSIERCAATGTLTPMGWCMPIASVASLIITCIYFVWLIKKGLPAQQARLEANAES
ncbi:MAG: MATE family efflux transporter [Oscillospiraceae bacterium]|nr:MATE family efflux transporter [Oscillospiraceae bacterium]